MKDGFYDIGKYDFISILKGGSDPQKENLLYQQEFYIHGIEKTYSRKIYSILDLLGDLGGIYEVFVTCIGIFIFPYSEFSYNMKVFEKIFLVRTTDPNLILTKPTKKKNSGKTKFKNMKFEIPKELNKSKNVASEVELHYPIKLSAMNSFKLYTMTYFGEWVCCRRPSCCSKPKIEEKELSTNDRLLKLYQEGTERFDAELGIEKLLKQLRDLRIYAKQNVLTD